MPRKIILDTDPGRDDAIALLLALASPEETPVLGVTAVAGNVPLAMTERNARSLCELAGRADIPVHAGCEAPLRRPLVTAELIHGPTGLDGIPLPPPDTPLAAGHAADFIIDTVRHEAPGSITLVAVGPLTNIATAFMRAPDIIPRIREVVLMGGAGAVAGNVTPVAEFNIHADPEAAGIVFDAGVPLVVLPLDVTRQALTTRQWVEGIARLGSRVAAAVVSWIGRFDPLEGAEHGHEGAPLHDPCAVAWLIRPDLFDGRRVNLAIETEGRFTAGMTVVDWRGVSGRAPNCLFITWVDRDGLLALLAERLARFPP